VPSLAPYQAVNMKDENNPHVIFQRDCQLYNAMIHPLLNYNFRGVIWYQGESNAYRYGIDFYNNAFTSLIATGEKSWSLGDIPFYYAQIAPWEYPKSMEQEWLISVSYNKVLRAKFKHVYGNCS